MEEQPADDSSVLYCNNNNVIDHASYPKLTQNQEKGVSVRSSGSHAARPLSYLEALLGDQAAPAPGLLVEQAARPGQQPHTSPPGQQELHTAQPGFVPSLAVAPQLGRARSVSFSVGSLTSHGWAAGSPVHGVDRAHASEAGSPTLEQVVLMSRSQASSGYSGSPRQLAALPDSPGSGLYSSLLPPHTRPDLGLPTLQPSTPDQHVQSERRPSLAEVVGIDLAVAHAVQNLQTLQQQQAALYCGLGLAGLAATPSQVSTPVPSESPAPPGPPTSSSSAFPFHQYKTPAGPALYPVAQPLAATDPLALERAARLYRSAASVCEASCTWSGQLPPRSSTAGPNSSYSCKIFLGGVPWDISEQILVAAFSEFGEVRVEWPGRDYSSPPKGYLYLVFQNENDVTDLLTKCSQDFHTRDSYYYKISSRRMRAKEVQIIPWVLADSNFVRCPSPRLDPQKTVFVGALHGMMTAQGLAVVFNDLFSGVVYAGLDTDKFKYPIGSGRVTFNNSRSYMKAVAAAFIEIKTPRFSKKVQVDPYLEDTLCSLCGLKQGPYFCRDLGCFNYFCHGCWDLQHSGRPHHKPLMRNIRGLTRARASQDYNNNSGGRYRADQMRELAEQWQLLSLQQPGSNNHH